MRYKLMRRLDLCERIQREMGKNAIPFKTDHVYDTYSHKWDEMPDIEKGKRIPFTLGLIRAVRKIRPDVLITEGFFQWTPLVVLYGILFKKPVYIGYERTLWTERNTKWWKTLHRKLTDKFVRGYLVNGSETKKYLQSIGIEEEKIHIGGMSADSSGLLKGISQMSVQEKDELRNKIHKRAGILYLFSGQIVERKGVRYLLDAWVKHVVKYPNDTLVLVGDGNQFDELRQKFAKEKSIVFEGKVDYIQIHQYYAIADVFILPTIEDNWSLVVPEAMACGLPIATSVYNGCHPELVHKDVNGITFDTFNQENIIEALDYFHYQNLRKMGEASIRIEKSFNTESCAKRVFDALINDNDSKCE